MHSSRGGNDTLVVGQSPSNAKVETLAVDVCHLATGLADDEVASGVVPDLFLVGGLDGQTEVNVTSAAGDGTVLGLAVHADAGLSDAELLRDESLVVMSRVASLDTLTEGGLGEVFEASHGNGLFGRKSTGGQRAAVCAVALNGREDNTATLVGGIGANVAGQTSGVVDRKVRAAEDADLDIAVDHESQANSVLSTTEETLSTVNGVNGPDATRSTSLAVSPVDELEHVVDVLDGASELGLCLFVIELCILDEIPDGLLQVGVLTQLSGLLLGDDGVIGKVVAEGSNDEGLGAKVADGDGRLVVLVDGALGLFVKDSLGEDGGPLDGQLSNLKLGSVRGGSHCSEGSVAEVRGEKAEAGEDGGRK